MSTSEERNYSFAFYNLENLFDTLDDPKTLDDDFTENSDMAWNEKRFRKKIKKLGSVIQQIGYDDVGFPPVLVGVAEIENKYVLEQLVASKFLQKKNYGLIHFDSPDERGIDTALLYRKDYIKVINSTAHTLLLEDETGKRDYTRDILHTTLKLENETIHVLVNHWPSRRRGANETAYRRMAAAQRNIEIISEIQNANHDARIIVMGDFNDDPKSASVQQLTAGILHNPMELLLTHDSGSVSHKGTWNLFDQIMFTYPFMKQHGNSFRFQYAKIFNPKHLTSYRGMRKGNPFRTYLGKYYAGGISDHFPIYAVFSLH